MLKVLCKLFISICLDPANNLLLQDILIVGVFVDDHLRYTWVYTVKNKSEVLDIFKKFYADTAIIRSKYPLCCIRRDNAGENMSADLKKWLKQLIFWIFAGFQASDRADQRYVLPRQYQQKGLVQSGWCGG